jgi:hypothetical protein
MGFLVFLLLPLLPWLGLFLDDAFSFFSTVGVFAWFLMSYDMAVLESWSLSLDTTLCGRLRRYA